eukprot:jgi/Botrbrau1/16573/Bobra.0068s0004.1
MVSVRSENVAAEVSGWRVAGGLVLREPVTASVVVTPALARAGLARSNPLLTDVVHVQSGTTVKVTLEPEGMRFPSPRTRVRMDPLRVEAKPGPLLEAVLKFLREAGLSELERPHLAVQTGEIETVVAKRGATTTHRLDILLGPSPSRGLHLAIWGNIEADKRLDMTLAIPADTLAHLGLKRVPPTAVLPLRVSGTITSPTVNWIRASTDLGILTLDNAAKSERFPFSKLLMRNPWRGPQTAVEGTPLASDVPQPISRLPWAK